MYVICLKEYLEKAVSFAERIASRANALPMLQNFLFSATDGKITLISTNLEIGLELTIPGKIQQEGKITVPAQLFSGFIRHLPNEKIELQEKNKVIHVRAGNTKALLQKLSSEEFPVLPSLPKTPFISFDGKGFLTGVSRVISMVSLSDARPELNGVLVKMEKKKIVFAATDTFRLGEFTLRTEQEYEEERQFIFPVKSAQEFIRVFSGDPVITASFTGQQAFFQTEDKVFVSRLLEGDYPPYQEIIPRTGATKITFSKNDLIQNLETVGLFSGKLQDVRVQFLPSARAVTLTAKNEGVGESETTVPVVAGEGDENNLVFNWRYLLDGLGQMDADEVTWWMNTETSPSLLFSSQKNGAQNFRYLLMPIRLS